VGIYRRNFRGKGAKIWAESEILVDSLVQWRVGFVGEPVEVEDAWVGPSADVRA
jgi:hypothetical protein